MNPQVLEIFKRRVAEFLDSGNLVLNQGPFSPFGRLGLCAQLDFDWNGEGGWSYGIISKLMGKMDYLCDFDKDYTEHGVLHEARYCFLYLIDMLTLEEFCEIVNTSDLTPSQAATTGAQDPS